MLCREFPIGVGRLPHLRASLAADRVGLGQRGPVGLFQQRAAPRAVALGGQFHGPFAGEQGAHQPRQFQAKPEILRFQVLLIGGDQPRAEVVQAEPGIDIAFHVADRVDRLVVVDHGLIVVPLLPRQLGPLQRGGGGLGRSRKQLEGAVELVARGAAVARLQETDADQVHGLAGDLAGGRVAALGQAEVLDGLLVFFQRPFAVLRPGGIFLELAGLGDQGLAPQQHGLGALLQMRRELAQRFIALGILAQGDEDFRPLEKQLGLQFQRQLGLGQRGRILRQGFARLRIGVQQIGTGQQVVDFGRLIRIQRQRLAQRRTAGRELPRPEQGLAVEQRRVGRASLGETARSGFLKIARGHQVLIGRLAMPEEIGFVGGHVALRRTAPRLAPPA